MAKVAFVSFRLKALDGVSVEAEKWIGIFEQWGFEVHRIAGQIPEAGERDHVISELNYLDPQIESFTLKAFDPALGRDGIENEYVLLEAEIERQLLPVLDSIGPDIVVVENVFSLPLNFPFTVVLCNYIEAEKIPCIAVHHDFYWQDPRFGHCAFEELLASHFPPQLSGFRHVTINERTREELFGRTGVNARCIRNCFDFDQPRGRDGFNAGMRAELGMEESDIMFLQPTRAIERKGIGLSIEFVEAFARAIGKTSRLVVTGPCEQGYEQKFGRLCRNSRAQVLHIPNWLGSYRGHPGAISDYDVRDAYAVSDVVTFPSSREGFGNPVLESVVHRKPLLVADYPVLDELREYGFQFLPLDDGAVDRTVKMMDYPQLMEEMAERNFEIGRRNFSLVNLRERLGELLGSGVLQD